MNSDDVFEAATSVGLANDVVVPFVEKLAKVNGLDEAGITYSALMVLATKLVQEFGVDPLELAEEVEQVALAAEAAPTVATAVFVLH